MSKVNVSHGDSVEIVCLDAPDAPWLASCPFPVHAMGPSARGYGYAKRLTCWLGENHSRFDVVVVNGLWQYHALGAWRALRKTSTPYFVYTHGMLDPWFKRTYPIKHLKKWLYWPWADYRVLRDAAAVLFTCEEERRLARQSFWLYRANERVVSYGTVGPPLLDGDALRRLFAERWPAAVGKRCLLHLGRVHEKKGTDLVLGAFASFLRSLPQHEAGDWHVVLAGPSDHPYGVKMKALATKLGLETSVTWTGMVTGEAKWAVFQHAEAFLLPSHQENFGIVVAESLACGKPVLISNKVNIWREIESDGAGLVEIDDGAGTLRLLARWRALDSAARWDMGRRAVASFRARFHIERAAENFMDVVREFVPSTARR